MVDRRSSPPTRPWRRWLFVVPLLLVAAACSGGGTGSQPSDPSADESTPMLQPDGPLRGLALVAEANRDGTFTEPQLTFTTNDTEATAVVGLGTDVQEDATLTVGWYRLAGLDGREPLFTHEIPVGPGGHAFSQGVAGAGLAPGLYQTVATLGDRQVRTPWVVRAADPEVAAAPGSPAYALMSTGTQTQSTLEDWEIPGPGESGWSTPEAPPAEPSPPGPCEIDNIFAGSEPMRDVSASVYWLGTCSAITLTATVSGPPQTLVSREIAEGDLSFLRGDADVCELPGGSDLPGTAVRFGVEGSDGARGSETYTLEDLGQTLTTGIESIPPAGSRVEPGQALSFHGIAMTFPPALGVERLSLYAGEELIGSVGNKSGSDEPQACDLRRLVADIVSRGQYRVPASPPPVIEICAEALGFDGTETRECIEFYTGEVWEGTVVWRSFPCTGSCLITYDIRLVVGPDRTALATGTFVSCTNCAAPPQEIAFEFRRAGDSFTGLTAGGYAMRGSIPITGSTASGKTTSSYPPFTYRYAWDLDCKTCNG